MRSSVTECERWEYENDGDLERVEAFLLEHFGERYGNRTAEEWLSEVFEHDSAPTRAHKLVVFASICIARLADARAMR